MIDISEPQSPGWWMARLSAQLTDPKRQQRLDRLDAYRRGEARRWVLRYSALEGASEARIKELERRRVHEEVTRRARTNWARLIINVCIQRMKVRTITTAIESDPDGDDLATELWRANDMPIHEPTLYRKVTTFGEAFVSVGMPNPADMDPLDPESKLPVFAIEDPRSMIGVWDSVRPQKVRVVHKLHRDEETETDYAYLWLPGELHVARRTRPGPGGNLTFSADSFDWDPELSARWEAPVVPIVRFATEDGMGDFEPHIDLLDRIDNDTYMRDTIALLQAFRQRAVKGDLPERDEQGNKIDYNNIFEADPGALWMLPEGAEMWESGQVDLGPVRSMATDDIKMLASVTGTPLYVVIPDVTMSAEGVSSMREGLVYRAEDHMSRIGQSHARVLSLALLFMGEAQRAAIRGLTVHWKPAERFSLSERASADSQAKSLTWRQKQEVIWQLSPQEIAQAKVDRAEEGATEPAESELQETDLPA